VERTGAVKGAGCATQWTLEGEDRSATLFGLRKREGRLRRVFVRGLLAADIWRGCFPVLSALQ
jgi:hypothetical protein